MSKKRKRRTRRRFSKYLFFRDIESVRFRENILTDKFIQFFEQEIWPNLESLHKGYKITEKKNTTEQITRSLICTGLTVRVVADNRNYNDKEARRRTVIWDALAKQN